MWRGTGGAGREAIRNARHARIALLLDNMLPGLRDLDGTLAPSDLLEAAVEANVRWSMQQLLDTPEGKARMAEGIVKLVGAVYELETGRVRFLPDDAQNAFSPSALNIASVRSTRSAVGGSDSSSVYGTPSLSHL